MNPAELVCLRTSGLISKSVFPYCRNNSFACARHFGRQKRRRVTWRRKWKAVARAGHYAAVEALTCGSEVPAENKQIPSGRATVNLERAEAQSFVPDGPSPSRRSVRIYSGEDICMSKAGKTPRIDDTAGPGRWRGGGRCVADRGGCSARSDNRCGGRAGGMRKEAGDARLNGMRAAPASLFPPHPCVGTPVSLRAAGPRS